MSSSEDSDAGPKRKRKLRRLDSSASSSSGSPIIKSRSAFKKTRVHDVNIASSDSDFSSSSDGSPILTIRKGKRVTITNSDSDSSDDSEIGRVRSGKPRRLESDESFSSQWESDYSESGNVYHPETKASSTAQNNNSDSEFSDGQSEKCPICLISFKVQEIGTPESCDHTFCLECIQEWSKNMNTCPVDRQEFNLILVRDSLNGKVTRQIPVERPVPQNEVDIFEDPTVCEICGSTDHEDRMLLCDGCDLGFHLFCLTPPLDEVPTGSWYCNECGSNESYNLDNEVFELHYVLEDYNERDRHHLGSLQRNNLRLIPRTRQSERVRRRIENNRNHNSLGNTSASTLSVDISRLSHAVTSSTSTPPKRTKRKKTRKSSKKIRYRTVYEIDKVTGETVARKKRMKRKSRKTRNSRRRNDRPTPKPKTVKKRLAQQLGICAPRTSTQNLPDVKIPNAPSDPSNNISGMRRSAGIPALHLFGYNNELDYFSEDNEDYSLGESQLLIRRAPNQSDAATMRRAIMRKNIIVPPEVVSSSSDLLDSILNTQEQFFARNASYSLDSSGKFKVETKKSKSDGYIDVTKEEITAKETPYYPNNNNNNNRNYNNRYNQNYRYNQYNRYQNQRQSNNYYNSNQNYYNSEPSSSMNYGGFSGNGGGDENDIPQDYSQRTLCATAESNLQGDEEMEEASEEANAANSESELDIYSDIETVTTSRAEENDPKPSSPPVVSHTPNTGTDEDNNDSEPDMVIDDEKIQEQEPQNARNREEAAVTSTVDITRQFAPPSDAAPGPATITNSSMEIQSEAVQSSSLDEHNKVYQYYNDDSSYGCPNANVYAREVKPSNDEENDSDDGCPNFSIYSKESKTLALHTDITTDRLGYRDYQVGEISSSPNIEEGQGQSIEPTNNPQDTYDPEQIYNSEPTVEDNQNNTSFNDADQSYDPEKIYNENDSPERNNADETYDPEACLHHDESTEIDADQSYDPEKIYEEEDEEVEVEEETNSIEEETNSIDQNCDYEKEVFKYKTTASEMNNLDLDVSAIIGDRYDPAVPFNDDLDESKSESQLLENDPINEQSFTDKDNKDKQDRVVGTSECNEESDIENADSQKEKQTKESKPIIKGGILGGLYSDSEEDDESIAKDDKNDNSAFAISDINHMTEDISEEERSYTPCLDEKFQKQGLEGLDTEMISDEDRNDFDESHELKTVSDGGDALEINAKESELDFTRPEDYEEGEIVDKNKEKDVQSDEPETEQVCDKSNSDKPIEEKKSKKKDKEKVLEDKSGNKENEAGNNEPSFKKLSRNNKDRNYRDKEKRHSSPKNESNKDRSYNKKDKKKEKRKELERYNVRAIIAEKPRPLIAKDQFGRDIRTTPSQSRSRSYTPPIRRSSSRPIRSPSKSRRSLSRTRRSLSRRRKSPSIDRTRKRRKSKNTRSMSRSRSRSPIKKNSPQKSKKRKRSSSRFRKRKQIDTSKNKKRVNRSRRRSRSATPVTRAPRGWERREWTPMSQGSPALVSPSWTPPRRMDNSQLLRNEHLTVTVNNSNKKKRDKKKKTDKRNKGLDSRQKRRRRERERTPPPSKEVFASGDNILVSVSFNNDNETRDVSTRGDKRKSDEIRKRREKKRKNRKDTSGIKPVAIIDLERSPFRELTPSPKQVIVLTDSDNEENDNLTNVQNNICDSSQQVASPERGIGPKTPPEPQVKFSLTVKPPQVRAINNPLHDPEDMETNDHVEDEMSSRMGAGIHIGPNTPPDPPNSPPSSPDAYDPFEPTKSRSPTPERQTQSKVILDSIDSTAAMEILDKSINPMPEVVKSLTPPLADIQPADSQSSVQVTPDSNLEKSPDRTGAVQGIQSLSLKPIAQTIPFSSVPTSIITSTPIPSNIPTSRINILNSTLITPPFASSIPQRIVLPNQVKPSPVKISPTKMTIKSTPIKPITNKKQVLRKRNQNGGNEDIILDFDSPYSPGSSDYEDLFEPPSEIVTKPVIKGKSKPSQKHNLSVFDSLFGSPNANMKQKKYKLTKKNTTSSKTKTVGVKLDEDNLKILDELPNSAVEMQVKDKFLKKLNRQERVVEEVKLVLKPHYNKKKINKEEYKDIMRRSVPKICHNKSGEINPTKIKNLIEAYVRKIKHSKKVTSSSSVNPQK